MRRKLFLKPPPTERSVAQHRGGTYWHEGNRMTIALQSPVRKIIFLAACLALTTVYIGLVAREFLADRFSQKLDLASLQMAARLQPGNAEYQYWLGHYFFLMRGSPDRAVQFLKSATVLNPHNASYWLELSRTYRWLDSPRSE